MEEKPSEKRLHAIVEGRVQGVGFRAFVVQAAVALGLRGWVRNRWNDTVEVTAEGPQGDLERLLEDLKRGPRSAFVTDLSIEWQEATGEFSRFSLRSTE